MADSRILRTSLAGSRGPRPVWPAPPHHLSCAVHRHAQTKQAQNGKTSRVLDGPLAGLLEAWGACQARLWEHAVAKSQHRHCKKKKYHAALQRNNGTAVPWPSCSIGKRVATTPALPYHASSATRGLRILASQPCRGSQREKQKRAALHRSTASTQNSEW